MPQITDEQYVIFRKNFDFMWSVMRISHWKAYENEKASSNHLLPCFTYLSRCKTEKPSLSTVYKIVNYFNANISPETSVHEFLYTDLTPNFRLYSTKKDHRDTRFLHFYKLFFMQSGEENAKLLSGLLFLFGKNENSYKARMITGFHTDEELRDVFFRNFLQSEKPSDPLEIDKHYIESHHTSRPTSVVLFEGDVTITEKSLSLNMKCRENECRRFITLDISQFIPSFRRPYLGGLAFVLETCDGAYDTSFKQMLLSLDSLPKPSMKADEDMLRSFLVVRNKKYSASIANDTKWFRTLFGYYHPGFQ